MAAYNPTRINLLILRKRLDWAKNGSELLRKKREALMKDFFGIIHDVTVERERLDGATKVAKQRLVLARAFVGEDLLFSAALAAKRDIDVNMEIKNIWGVNLPEIEERGLKRALEARGFSPIGESMWTLSVSDSFEEVLTLILRVASHETKLSRLGQEIRATTRKINALDESLIPTIERNIRRIAGILEEREKEEIFRLKRFKKRK